MKHKKTTYTDAQLAPLLADFRAAIKAQTELWDAVRRIENGLGQDFNDMTGELQGFSINDEPEPDLDEFRGYIESLEPDGDPHDSTATCKFCGTTLERDAHGTWVDGTKGDCCPGNQETGENENQAHQP